MGYHGGMAKKHENDYNSIPHQPIKSATATSTNPLARARERAAQWMVDRNLAVPSFIAAVALLVVWGVAMYLANDHAGSWRTVFVACYPFWQVVSIVLVVLAERAMRLHVEQNDSAFRSYWDMRGPGAVYVFLIGMSVISLFMFCVML